MEDRPMVIEFLCLACGTQGTRLVEGGAEEGAATEPGPGPGFSCPRCGSEVLQPARPVALAR
ncbi:MAG: hypothetical protein RDU89_05980 [bacterium]|nr:hypothetical protein [bacterium]